MPISSLPASACAIRPSTRPTGRKPRPAAAGHALTPRALYGRQEVLEGAAVEGVVILEFPTFAEARAYFDSPAYQEAREHRFKGADYRAVIVEGV